MTTPGFLWGAATAGHQVEGNNASGDWWAREQTTAGMEFSGAACDIYHSYREDITLLADAGLTAYRFSLEWSRIEPVQGRFSRAELAHYEPPWVSWRLLVLETRMELCRRSRRRGKPQTRRYSGEEKAAAVRMVRTLRAELGAEHCTVGRVAFQLGYGVESVPA